MADWKPHSFNIYNYAEELDSQGVTRVPNTAVHIWASYLDSHFNLMEKNKL